MSAKEISSDKMPGFSVVQQTLGSIDRDITVVSAAYEFDPPEAYLLNLSGRGRKGRAVLPYELLSDIRDNKQAPGSEYTRGLHGKLASVLREAVEKMA